MVTITLYMRRRRQRQPTPVFLPGESQGWGSLVGCCLWGHTESDRLKRPSSSSLHETAKETQIKEQTFGLCGRRRGWDDLRE